MRRLGLLLLGVLGLALTFGAAASRIEQGKFVEENDLWKQDRLFKSMPNVTEEEFNKIIQLGTDLYQPIAVENGEMLVIQANWEDATVNAGTTRIPGFFALVMMYGGLARRPEIRPEGFALVMCHELGHLYGGLPYIQEENNLSAEGQADYYGENECLKKLLPEMMSSVDPQQVDYWVSHCTQLYAPATDDYTMCLAQLSAGISLGKLLAVIKEEPVPQYETPDQTVVDVTETSYPKTVQCRLDTYHNGSLNLPRPKCWFKD